MRNYLGRGLCYLPKAEADNTNRGLNNSSYPTRTEFNNCFIIYLYLQTFSLKKSFVFQIWHKQHKPFVFCIWHKQHKLV